MLPVGSLTHRYGMTYNIASEQGTHFAGRGVWEWACALASTGCITHCTVQRQLASWSARMAFRRHSAAPTRRKYSAVMGCHLSE